MGPNSGNRAVLNGEILQNLSAGLRGADGRWAVTAFCNNVFNKIYYQDVEDFWSAPWSNSATVVGQPARDAQRYGGVRFDWKL